MSPFLSLLLCLAQQPAAAPAPREALLFKSGQAYLVREVAVAAGAETVRLRLPEGIHGTIWLGAEGPALLRANALLADDLVEKDTTDLAGVLRLALGRPVLLEIAAGQETQTHSAVLERLLETPAVVPAGAPPEPARPSAVVLSTGLVVPIERVLGVNLKELPATWKYQAPVRRPVLDVALRPSGSAGTLTLSSMANGLAWAPSYVLQLGAGGQARLVGKAVIVNDLEDLVDTRLRLVVGYPNLKFAQVRDPLLPEVALNQFQAMIGQQGQAEVGVLFQNFTANAARFDAAPAGPAQAVDGSASEDLYIYDLGPVSVRRGERAYLPLLEQEVEFRHRFDWELPDKVDRYANFSGGGEAEEPPVWHVLRLRNGGRAPWTTAPILVTGEQGPLAQSTIDYTPVGGENGVQLTKALDIVGKALEIRADDARAARESVVLFGSSYERVRVRGTLELKNHSQRAAPMHVVKQLSGDLASTPKDCKVEGQVQGLGQINPARTLTWEFELPAGGTWKAEYEYAVLIRR